MSRRLSLPSSVTGRAALATALCASLCRPAWAGQATTQPQQPTATAADVPDTRGRAEAGPTSFSPWQWVALGLGTALVAGGATSMILGFGDASKADDGWSANPPTLTQQEYDDLRQQASTKQTIGYILTGVGGAALIAGGVLLALELVSDEAREEMAQRGVRVAFGLAPLPGGGAANLGFGFWGFGF